MPPPYDPLTGGVAAAMRRKEGAEVIHKINKKVHLKLLKYEERCSIVFGKTSAFLKFIKIFIRSKERTKLNL